MSGYNKLRDRNRKEYNLLLCLNFVKTGIEQQDKDMVRSYYEQLNDLIIEFLGEEKPISCEHCSHGCQRCEK